MKFITLIAAAFIPHAVLAAPFADAQAGNGAELFSRAAQNCKIVGDSAEVNCRSGASTSSDAVYTVDKGSTYKFTCVKTGECVTIGGKTNCGWHKTTYKKCYINQQCSTHSCYVSGHYTDSRCTQANLGWC